MKVYVIHGPNMNMLGIREPDIYGRQTYDDLVEYIRARCEENGMEPEFFQSNHEGTLVDIIQQAYYEKVDAIIINPAAYTHTSIAIHDALKASVFRRSRCICQIFPRARSFARIHI